MGYSRELFEQVGKDLPTIEGREPHNSIKSVQNLEAIINEGLRVALMEETPDQSLEVLLKYLGKALNGERTYIFERNESGNDDNTYEWVADGVEPEKEKQGVCLNGYHQDITEIMVTRKKQEQAIMELLERVRRANSAKSEFLSRMSHDLRTPINGILGMLSILDRSQNNPERQKDCRKKIRVSTEHLLSTTFFRSANWKAEGQRQLKSLLTSVTS